MSWRYLGPDQTVGQFAERRAAAAGFAAKRAQSLGHFGSFRDGWIFRKKVAKAVGCSERTVQRAITQAQNEGLLGVARGGKNEIPPGAKAPIPCGWSHRWTIGRGLAGEAQREAVNKAKLARLMRRSFDSGAKAEPLRVPHAPRPSRGLTPEQRAQLLQLEADERAELEALAAGAIAATEARQRDGPAGHN